MLIALSESRIYRIREAQPTERLGKIDLNGLNFQPFALLLNIIGDSRRGKDAANILTRYPIFNGSEMFILHGLPNSAIWIVGFYLYGDRSSCGILQ